MPVVIEKICKKHGWKFTGNAAIVPLPGGRAQAVQIQEFEADGEEMARFFTIIGSADILNETRLRAALRANANMGHGALAILEGQLAILDTFMLREADQDEVRASIEFMAQTADDYERLIFRTDEN